ncbi:hypothetical protein [Pluralibacter gergoviae]|uniref:Type IV secretion protein Rhs n=2 Tax=Pluralibacter gergoviae TaxID=61647 RepID=A0A0J5N442_PLUGE|nr:hypothetical protein [Pluralibacter gergoviae]AVR02338.1 hypothetical protein A8H26_06265 [Pluralibacter gergoviae]EKV0932972.1 hypothetical protein [Pluralibacter gergoviae]EKV6248588.1 hypothetical protein [Pluralibacter gergoviae]EKW9967499.1 hypothetical protein [Pluralibacter gergoviae]ELD4273165.1 hypothetical protein [Pluralibacter gergoviae]
MLPEGSSRLLTVGEISLARTVFRDAIKYYEVKVHNDSYLPFNMQSADVAMTPNGEIYYRDPHYRDDFSTEVPRYKHWFIHEMVHVLQHQVGMNVRTRGAFSWAASYEYSLPSDKKLADFGMEQQASIVSDYFFLVNFGLGDFVNITGFKGIIGPDLKEKYKKTLEDFLRNPKDKRVWL